LVERARDGDDVAFSELVDLDGDLCYAIAYRILRDAGEPRTPSSRHSSSPGANSPGCATRNASAHGSTGCS
jgi:hypothetical protein